MKERVSPRPTSPTWLPLLLVLLLALGALPAAADDAADREKALGPVSPAVERVLALTEAKDTDGLRALIDDRARMGSETDPWFIVHELLLRNEYRAATRFAEAGTRVEVKHLKAYAQRIGRRKSNAGHWRVLQAAFGHLRRSDWSDVVTVVEDLDLDDEGHEQATVATVALREVQALAYQELGDAPRTMSAAKRAARRAADMGWWVAARDNNQLWLQAAGAGQALEEALQACAGLEDVYTALGNRAGVARAKIDGASLLSMLCRFDPAVVAFQDVLDDYAEDIDVPTEVHVRNSLAIGHKVLGRYARAQREAARARGRGERGLADAIRKLQGARDGASKVAHAVAARRLQLQIPWALQTLGLVALEIGDFDEAARLLHGAVAQLEALDKPEYEPLGQPAFLEEARANVSVLEMWLLREQGGDIAKAKAGMEARLRYYTKTNDKRYVQVARFSLAEILRREAEALPAGPEREKLLRDVLGRLEAVREGQQSLRDRYALCITLREIASTYLALASASTGTGTKADAAARKQALERARYWQKRALKLAHEIGALDEETRCRAALARIELKRGRPEAALEASFEAVLGISSHFDSLPPGQAALARGKTSPVYAAGLQAAVLLDDAARAFFFLDGARAGALLTGIDRTQEVRDATIDPRLRTAEAAARKAEAAAYAVWMHAEDVLELSDQRAAYKAFEAARRTRKHLIQQIQLAARLEADLKYALPADPKEVRDVLSAEEAMVILGAAGEEAVAVVLRREKTQLVKLGPSAVIAAACAALSTEEDAGPRLREISALRDLIVMPLGLGPDVRRVLLSLDGCLAYQPPALLFPNREVVCIPSGTAYVRALRERAPVLQGRVIAVGDPVYGRPPIEWGPRQRSAKRGGRLRRIPGTGIEVQAVGDLVLVRAEATETRVRTLLAEKERLRALHFACHGRVDEDSTDYSALALTSSKEDDGLLTALEIHQLEIDADLVVLSACESGRGRRSKAEGIVGLTNAFLFAGARRVLVSLWNVDDEASRVLMVEFHRRWNHKDPKMRLGASAALRAAQEHVRTYAQREKDPRTGKPAHPEWQDPHYWAAWQLWGSPD